LGVLIETGSSMYDQYTRAVTRFCIVAHKEPVKRLIPIAVADRFRIHSRSSSHTSLSLDNDQFRATISDTSDNKHRVSLLSSQSIPRRVRYSPRFPRMVTAYWRSKRHRGHGLIEKACNERQQLLRVLVQHEMAGVRNDCKLSMGPVH